jgi:hypothetical protein
MLVLGYTWAYPDHHGRMICFPSGGVLVAIDYLKIAQDTNEPMVAVDAVKLVSAFSRASLVSAICGCVWRSCRVSSKR